jgi:hypothetical protein
MFLWLLAAAERLPMALLGAGAGLLVLTNTGYALAVPVIVGAAAGRRWRSWAVGMTAAVLMLLPWTVRNYRQFERIFFVRDNLYTELWLGNRPGATGWMTMAALAEHPSDDSVNRRQVLALGETGYGDLCRRRFMQEYGAGVGEFWGRCGRRAVYLIAGEPGRQGAALNVGLAVIGLAGAWAIWRVRRTSRAILIAAVAAVLPYVPTQVHDRYALPLRAILCVTAGVGIGIVWKHLSVRFHSRSNPTSLRQSAS